MEDLLVVVLWSQQQLVNTAVLKGTVGGIIYRAAEQPGKPGFFNSTHVVGVVVVAACITLLSNSSCAQMLE